MKTEGPGVEGATALLRRFEPVIRSTTGISSTRWMSNPTCGRAASGQRPGEEALCVVPGGKLSLDRLAQQPMDEAGAVHFLKFTDTEDLRSEPRGGRLQLFRRRAKDRKESTRVFRAGRGRLARVGYFSRFVDALYSIALLARGRVQGIGRGGFGGLRAHNGRERTIPLPRSVVARRLDRPAAWLFYPFNDWRSGFFGANDHEADWEKVMVYLSESESGGLRPEWVAYAAHNYTGTTSVAAGTTRRSRRVGEHPVIYVGAGSTPATTRRAST